MNKEKVALVLYCNKSRKNFFRSRDIGASRKCKIPRPNSNTESIVTIQNTED